MLHYSDNMNATYEIDEKYHLMKNCICSNTKSSRGKKVFQQKKKVILCFFLQHSAPSRLYRHLPSHFFDFKKNVKMRRAFEITKFVIFSFFIVSSPVESKYRKHNSGLLTVK